MDLIQKGATIALLTLLLYFILVNIIDRHGHGGQRGPSGQSGPGQRGPSHGLKTEGKHNAISTDVGVHHRTVLGPVAPSGGENVTQLSVYDEHQKGILPVNHNPQETPVEFELVSGITNLSQFYRNNPEVFDKTMTSVSDADGWHKQSQAMFSKLVNQPPNQEINPWNFEKDPLSA